MPFRGSLAGIMKTGNGATAYNLHVKAPVRFGRENVPRYPGVSVMVKESGVSSVFQESDRCKVS